MNMNRIGKFQTRSLLNEFDAALIRLYGRNMLDASISRYEALEACEKHGSPDKAAEILGARACGMDASPRQAEESLAKV